MDVFSQVAANEKLKIEIVLLTVLDKSGEAGVGHFFGKTVFSVSDFRKLVNH